MGRRAVLFASFAMVTACLRPAPQRGHQVVGTCEGACDTYLSCRGDDDQNVMRGCLADCREIFVDDQGTPDKDTLRELEALSCEDLVAYIEGPQGRAPEPRRRPVD